MLMDSTQRIENVDLVISASSEGEPGCNRVVMGQESKSFGFVIPIVNPGVGNVSCNGM